MISFNCPYCDAEIKRWLSDFEGNLESVKTMECPHCGKYVGFNIEIRFVAEAHRVPCLNGEGEHDWDFANHSDRNWAECRACGKEVRGFEVYESKEDAL